MIEKASRLLQAVNPIPIFEGATTCELSCRAGLLHIVFNQDVIQQSRLTVEVL